MFNHAIAKKPLPKYHSTDNDPLLRFHRWRANLKILHIEEIKAVPFMPVSHSFVERLDPYGANYWTSCSFGTRSIWTASFLVMPIITIHSGLAGATPNELAGGSKLPIASLFRISACHTATAYFRHRSPFDQQVRDTHGSVLGGTLRSTYV